LGLDAASEHWLLALRAEPPRREAAVASLHELAVAVARSELRRRRARLHGPELDDVAHQAAGDAVLAILAKLDQFRGESKFTTWAYRFVVLEVSAKLGRHFWRAPVYEPADGDDWEQIPDRFGLSPQRRTEWVELVAALRDAVEHELTPHQRTIFTALVLREVPLDALVVQVGSNRNAIYKTMFDTRRKLRRTLAAKGYMRPDVADGG
jgi:RNA polymerase sigma-70 factor (ECF subfamily)